MITAALQSTRAQTVSTSSKGGFSLVELLTCIAILGIILALAIPSLAGILTASTSSKSLRQAQVVAQTYASACAAGAVFADANPQTVVDALTRCGGVRGRGIFADMTFQVSLSAAEKAEVVRCEALIVNQLPDGTGQLGYRPGGAR